LSAARESEPLIYVVDDDDAFRTAIERLLRAANHCVRGFASVPDFLEFRQVGRAGCVLADLQMPGATGIDLQAELARTGDALPVVFVTAYGDIPTTVHAMRAGAVDFLTKPIRKEALFGALQQALQLDAAQRRQLSEVELERQRLASLTPREQEVLRHVIAGKANKQTAYELKTVERTIKAHRANIVRKLGVASVAELVRLAERLQIPPAH
jgi:FixJ family two-component response regulator